MVMNSYSFLVGPLVAFGALVVLILICRWVFSTKTRDERTARRLAALSAPRGGDYGLLVPIATVRTRADAEMLRSVLLAGGVRCTVSVDDEGADVLVFRADALRARDLVSS